jgi:hypothetical protein
VNPAGYHAIFVGITTGMLVFAFIALAYRVWFSRPRGGAAQAAWDAADSVALYAALAGTAILALAIASGFVLRPLEAFLNSPITKNKILTAMLAIACWASFLAIRIKSGPMLWRQGFTAHMAFIFAAAGFIFLVTTNSIGGDIAGIPSGYEQMAQAIGFRTRHATYFPTWINVVLWLVGIAALVGGIMTAKRGNRGVRRLVD